MSQVDYLCPKCGETYTVDPPKPGRRLTCPACKVEIAPVVEEFAEEIDVTPKSSKKKRKAGPPAWAVGLLGVVVLAAVGAVAFFATRPGDAPGRAEAKANGGPDSDVGKPIAIKPRPATGAEPVPAPGPRAAAPPELADIICLLPDDAPPSTPDPYLREIIRQSLWLAAREEFGLRVRDTAIGDVAPEGLPADRHFRLRGGGGAADPWQWVLGAAGAEHRLWSGALRGIEPNPEALAAGIAAAEEVSRGLARKCLEAAGFEPKSHAPSDAPVPANVEALLGTMRETDQFAAARLLHAEVRAKGESPALVSALARAYAHLGVLTEHHWSYAPYAFRARSLLYAQRLVARGTPGAARVRGYAAALAGLHRVAMADFETASKDPAAGPVPAWAAAADGYARFDLTRLAAARKGDPTGPAGLLHYLAAEEPRTPAATLGAGREYLRANPEGYRVHDGQCRTGGVISRHVTSVAGVEAFVQNLAPRLREMPDVPAAVTAAAGGADEGEVYAALRAAGGGADRGEPSWAAVGAALQTHRFQLALHRLEFVANMLGLPPGDEAREFLPSLRGHPLIAVIEGYAVPKNEVVAKLKSAPVPELPGFRVRPYYALMQRADPGAGPGLGAGMKEYALADRHFAWQYSDLVGRMWDGQDGGRSGEWAQALQAISPRAPHAQAILVAPRYCPAEQLPAVEQQYADFPLVQRALGERHMADGRHADAVRCWQRSLRQSPDGDSYRALAAAYRKAGQVDSWRETLEESLAHEDTGLSHAQVRVELAQFYMAKKQYTKAEPYALAAAGTGAAWAMLCAARCKEGLGEFDEAEEFYAAAAARYGGPAFDWYFASRFTGKMNQVGAERAVRRVLAENVPLPPGLAFPAARYYLLTGDPAKARGFFNQADARGPTEMTTLFAALSDDAAGDRGGRDGTLGTATNRFGGKDTPGVKIAGMLRAWLARPALPDAAAAEKAIEELPPEARPDADFFVGWLLHNRGQTERAVAHWKRCSASDAGLPMLKTHARAFLADR